MKKIILLLLIVVTFPVRNALGQNNQMLVKIIHNNIIRYDLATESQATLYSKPNITIQDLNVSPNGNFLTFIEVKEGIVSGNEYSVLPSNTLHILDKTGNMFYSITEDVKRYAWSPDENKIAYITGRYYEGGIGFYPEATYCFDLDTKEKVKVEGLNYPYELNWKVERNSFFIKNLYPINNNKVFIFDLDKSQLIPTNYYDLHFSPDGEYYAHFPDEVDPNFKLFQTNTNDELQHGIYLNLGLPIGWVFDKGHLFLFEKKVMEIKKTPSKGPLAAVKKRDIKSIKYSIFDTGKKNVVKELVDIKLGEWISQPSILTFTKDGKVNFFTLSNLIED